jgi:hypothetical protein
MQTDLREARAKNHRETRIRPELLYDSNLELLIVVCLYVASSSVFQDLHSKLVFGQELPDFFKLKAIAIR